MIAGRNAFLERDVTQLALQLRILATRVWRKSNEGLTPLLCNKVVKESIARRVLLGSRDSESALETTILIFALYTHKEGVTVDKNEAAAAFNFVFLRIYTHHAHRFSHAIREVVEACVDNVPVSPERLDNKLGQECRLSSRRVSHNQDN